MRIERFDGMNETPAVRLSYECTLELMAKGQARPEVHLHWSFPCIVAYADDGEPVGAIVYEDRVKSARDIWIQSGYVSPAHRGKGYYRALWNEAVAVAQGLGARFIRGATNIDNAEMRATARALGRVEDGVMLRFDVPKKEGAP